MTTFEATSPGVPKPARRLGLHQYDGRLTDYSQASLDSELARLKILRQRLGRFRHQPP